MGMRSLYVDISLICLLSYTDTEKPYRIPASDKGITTHRRLRFPAGKRADGRPFPQECIQCLFLRGYP